MNWKDYDKEILIPYEKTGSFAQEFAGDTIVFSYSALRHVAYHAFQAGKSHPNHAMHSDGEGQGKSKTLDEGLQDCDLPDYGY